MSIDVMSLIFKAKIEDVKVGEKTVTAPVLKFLLIALADHCNDEGDGAYPSLKRLENKTAFSHQTVLNGLEALRQEGLIIRVGISRKGTSNYSLNIPMLTSLVHQVDYLKFASTSDSTASTPGGTARQPGVPEPSFNHPINHPNNKPQKNEKEYNFVDMNPGDALKIPEIKVYVAATGFVPPAGQYETIYRTIRAMNGAGTAENLRKYYRAWVDKGWRGNNLTWLTEWAASGKIPDLKKKFEPPAPDPAKIKEMIEKDKQKEIERWSGDYVPMPEDVRKKFFKLKERMDVNERKRTSGTA